eukprot:1231898-Pleurochrysis_carterae.AAC.1
MVPTAVWHDTYQTRLAASWWLSSKRVSTNSSAYNSKHATGMHASPTAELYVRACGFVWVITTLSCCAC